MTTRRIRAAAVVAPPTVRLVSGGVTLEAAGPDGAPSRTVAGLAVPYNVTATVDGGQRVRFLPGSLPVDGENPLLLLGHDRSRAVGVVTTRHDGPDGMRVAARVSAVPDGDHALVLAADGVLNAFSVGVDPLEYTYEDDGTMVVTAGAWREVSLLPFGAFPTARVATVTAAEPDLPATVEAGPATTTPPVVVGPPATLPVGLPAVPARPVTLGRVAALIAGINGGQIDGAAGRAELRAVLSNVVVADVAAVTPPAYRAEIIGLIDHGRPIIDAISSSTLPASGMAVEYPQWTVLPTVGKQATEKTAITSTAATMTLQSAPVGTWAGGNDLSLQAVERTSPSFLEAYLRAMALDYARKTDTYVSDTLWTAATAATGMTVSSSFIEDLASLFAKLDLTAVPAGALWVAVAWNLAAPLIGVTSLNGPAFWDGAIRFGSNVPTVEGGGLDVFVDPYLPANRMLLGARNGATWHENPGAPADIRVVDVSLLGLDVGVYGFGALTIEYPAAFVKLDKPIV